MTDWIPLLGPLAGPRYLAIVAALEADIESGRVKPGFRLPPQRDLALSLGLSVGTVSKAYAEAEQRGLISGEVGRGTFVQRRMRSAARDEAPLRGVNFALNVPPATGEEVEIEAALGEIARDGSIQSLIGYLPHQGRRDHRAAIAGWLNGRGMAADPEKIAITQGLQHALSISLALLAGPRDTILTEALTYSGTLALAAHGGYRLHGVALDAEGLVPAALDRAFAETGARVLYCMSTLQTPTTATASAKRREEIAAILRRRSAYLIEDDAYGFLPTEALTPISALIPERSFYMTSFAKCLAPGLRIGALIGPDEFRARIINALRATGWMAAPIMADVVARLIDNGGLERQIAAKRIQAAARTGIARQTLGEWLPNQTGPSGFHVWLPLPAGRTVSSLIMQAAEVGLTIAAPGALQPLDPASAGVRLCLGAAQSEVELEGAVQQIRRILDAPDTISLV